MTAKAGKFAADAIISFHVAWLSFIYFGWPFLFWYPNFNEIYFPVICATLLSRVLLRNICIFTDWENHFRKKYDPQNAYTEKCMPYYTERWFGYRVDKPIVIVYFGGLFILSTFLFAKSLMVR